MFGYITINGEALTEEEKEGIRDCLGFWEESEKLLYTIADMC